MTRQPDPSDNPRSPDRPAPADRPGPGDPAPAARHAGSDAPAGPRRAAPTAWVLRQVRSRVPALLLLVAAEVGYALFGVVFALGSRGVIDAAVAGDGGAFARACLVQALIIAGTMACLTLARHLRERLRADLERDWKRRLLHGLLHADYAAAKGYHSAEILNRLNNDVTKVNEGVVQVLPAAASMVARLVAAVAVLGVLDARLTLLVVVLGAAVLVVTGVMRGLLKGLNKQVSEHDGRVSAFLQEVAEKFLVVQAMDASAEMERRATVLLDARYLVQRRRKNVSLAANTGVSAVSYGAGFLALVWCAWRLLHGQMTFGSLTAVVQLVGQLQTPFVSLSGVLPQYVAMVASAERLMELEAISGQPEPSAEPPERLYGRLRTIGGRGLCFAYERDGERDAVLDGASFELPKGAFVAVTGPSGTGKSTLLKLLLGVYRPQAGALFASCDGGEVAIDRSTRRLFAYVPQGDLLLSGTLRENLTVACPDATDDQLAEALHAAMVDEFLDALPQGVDTPLGEDGAGLSGGQAQRLAIARAVLGAAPVLLLDECTSALDEATEREVLRRLRALPGRTIVAVTHRPAALELATWHLEFVGTRIDVHDLEA